MTGSPRSGAAVARDWVRALETTQRLAALPDPTLPAVVAAMARTRGDAPALIGRSEQLSYAQLDARAGQFARWALGQGLGPGDVVGLLMENRPDYVAIWLGLTRAGCVVALLNTQLRAEGLAHCIAAAQAHTVIVSSGLAGCASGQAGRWWVHGDDLVLPGPGSDANLPALPDPRRPALLLYTSGTTGLPKAARVSHARVLEWSGWFAGMMQASPQDRLYDCLPLCHSTGGIVAVGAMLVAGGAVVIRERFSASGFWDDVAQTRCTVFQYIGELCRYLLQSPGGPPPTGHCLRLACGNGLRGEVWTAFQQRFHVPRILEFYAATEGSLSLTNCEGRPGAVGRIPPFLAHRFPVALIRCDPDTGEPLRDPAGRCARSDPGEPGEAVAQLGAAARFEGYTDADASRRKVLHGVFAPGDRWFRSGDLMRRDAAGFYAFVDRLGDTYRWKGENVAAAEVAATIAACPGVTDAVAYGVTVPGTEGKAGMAALSASGGFDLAALHAHLGRSLPSYARPLFIRLCPAIERTGTFKLSKVALAREGFAGEAVWFDDGNAYVPLDAARRARIERGAAALRGSAADRGPDDQAVPGQE